VADPSEGRKKHEAQPPAAKPPVLTKSAALQAIGALPPLSTVAIQLQRLTEDDADMRTVANAISVDPGLSADVLRMANSALFGARHTVPGVLHAIVMLGLDRVKALVFTAAFMRFANPARSEGTMKRCWRHSVACALISDEISSRANTDRDVAYTAGILHDIGRLAMLRLWKIPYGSLLDAAVPGDAEILEREHAEFAVTHTEAGGYLLRRWRLPQALTAAAEHHHDAAAPPIREPAGAVHCACALADAVGFPAAGGPCEAAPDAFPALQGLIPGNLEDLQFRVATRMNALEVWL
jgi:putative nucleotidyltransferase with HDIG domain